MTQADLAAQHGLHRVGGRPPLLPYLGEVWRRREFILTLARFRIEAENGQNRLGMGWVVLKPLINAAVYGVVFGLLLRTHRGVDDFIAFLVIGIMMFEFFSTSLTTGAKSITSNAALVQSLSFPRMALPLALVAQRLYQFVPMVVMMALTAVALGNYPTWDWLLFVPLVALFAIFNTGIALFAARLTVHFRDLTQLLPFVSRFLLYSTGIFFSLEDKLEGHPTLQAVGDWLPLHEFITLGRSILLSGEMYEMEPKFWAMASLWTVVVAGLGTVFFWAAEERYGRTD